MQEITIISGKGGTGKTSVTAALAAFAKNTVFCDNDVDAADLHLLFAPQIKEENTFDSGSKAIINYDKCTNCGLCQDYCRFDAIHHNKDDKIFIDLFECEGCRLCERICPEEAIFMERSLNNFKYVSDTRFGTLVHATMGPGEENSGKLVTDIRKQARNIAKEQNADFVINDGPPGIGCAAISSITGTDKVLLVIEPSKSGFHDIKRLIELINNFKIKRYAVINKADINNEISKEIEEFLKEQNIPLIEKIPFDKKMVEALVNKQTITEYLPDSEISHIFKNIWTEISKK